MDKVIKEFNNEDLVYKLGYNLLDNKVYPRIQIYKGGELLSGGGWFCGTDRGLFCFGAGNFATSNSYGYIGTIKGMFNKLRQYNEIPQNVEQEYKNMFLTYKLNGFRED